MVPGASLTRTLNSENLSDNNISPCCLHKRLRTSEIATSSPVVSARKSARPGYESVSPCLLKSQQAIFHGERKIPFSSRISSKW